MAGNMKPETTARLEAIAQSPRYRVLVQERSRLAFTLTAIMLAIYYGYVLLIAFSPAYLARPLGEGVTTLGIPVGIGVILSGIALTGVYVVRANRRFDALERAVREEAAGE